MPLNKGIPSNLIKLLERRKQKTDNHFKTSSNSNYNLIKTQYKLEICINLIYYVILI